MRTRIVYTQGTVQYTGSIYTAVCCSIGRFDSCQNGTGAYDTFSEGKRDHNNIPSYQSMYVSETRVRVFYKLVSNSEINTSGFLPVVLPSQ